MASRFRPVVVLPLLCAATVACHRESGRPTETVETARFEEVFELVDTIHLEQADSLPIVRVSGMDVDGNGALALSDASEGMVKRFTTAGGLARIVARKGNGPAEFQVPFDPRFDRAGNLHVPDFRSRHLAVFDTAGRLLRRLQLADFQVITDFELLPSGEYLVAGQRAGGGAESLHRVSADGKIVESLLPLGAFRPAGQPDAPSWFSVRRTSAVPRGDTTFVVNTLADSLWTVVSGRTNAEGISLPGYVRPSLPREALQATADVSAWARTFHSAAAVFAGDDFVLIPFVQGTLFDGDPTIYALRGRDGSWTALTGGPPVVRARGDVVYAILDPLGEKVLLGRYRLRP